MPVAGQEHETDGAGLVDVRSLPNLNLARGLLALEAFTAARPNWGVRELARALETNPTTMHRLLTTLEAFGYVEQDQATSLYRLGPKIMRIASTYSEQNKLPVVARRVFEEFSDRFDHSFYLGVLSNFDVVYVAVLDGRGALKISMQPGGRTALYSTGMGKILLASQDDEFIEAFLKSVPLKKNTPRTITFAKDLWKEVEEIRRLGYAVNYGEHFAEVGAVAVPLRDSTGAVIGGLSLGFPIMLLSSGAIDIDSLRTLADETAAAIRWRLDGRSD